MDIKILLYMMQNRFEAWKYIALMTQRGEYNHFWLNKVLERIYIVEHSQRFSL